MIVLDTNVLSELMRESPHDSVLAWVNAQLRSELFTTSITEAEILRGISVLARGRRREALAAKAGTLFDSVLRDKVLPFDSSAAKSYALIESGRRRAGRPISTFDAQIAAVVVANGGRLATRNVDDFVDCGVDIIDPWRLRKS